MFLFRLNPSCSFCCSVVDPPWHFSAGTHEASCHWQAQPFSYNIQSRHKRVVSTLLFLSVCNVLLHVPVQGHWMVTSCSFLSFLSHSTQHMCCVCKCKCQTRKRPFNIMPCVNIFLVTCFHLKVTPNSMNGLFDGDFKNSIFSSH